MENSKNIAALLGPIMAATIISEFPLVQPHLYDAQIPPVVYLSGLLWFIGGLVVVRAQNRWARDWTVLITITGWFLLLLGLFRMFAAGSYLQGSQNTGSNVFMVLEGAFLIVELIITYYGYRPEPK
jgi:hypothetical protein